MAKVLSIVIPTYNMEKYLRHCLDSLIVSDDLMCQLEVLVVNDGSKDKSSEIGHEYEAKYPQTFKVIDKENGNYGSCINVGLKNASGKYIKVLDADDSFDTNSFAQYLTFLNTVDVDLIISDYDWVNENGDVINTETFDFPEKQVLDYQAMNRCSTFNSIQMHSAAYRTENLVNMGYHQTEGISYTDQEWMFAPVTTVKKGVYIKTTLYKYLVGREGQTMDEKVLIRNISHTQKGLDAMMAFYGASKFDSQYVPYLESRMLKRIMYIYFTYLTRGYSMNLSDLETYDKKIKEASPKLYSCVDDFTVGRLFKYHYAKKWRESYYKSTPSSVSIRLKLSRWI